MPCVLHLAAVVESTDDLAGNRPSRGLSAELPARKNASVVVAGKHSAKLGQGARLLSSAATAKRRTAASSAHLSAARRPRGRPKCSPLRRSATAASASSSSAMPSTAPGPTTTVISPFTPSAKRPRRLRQARGPPLRTASSAPGRTMTGLSGSASARLARTGADGLSDSNATRA